MAVFQLHKSSFIYIRYNRETFRDFLTFRGTLFTFVYIAMPEKDLFIDVLRNDFLTNWELSALSVIIKKMEGYPQHLRIFAPTSVKLKITSLHHPLPVNVSFFNNMHALVDTRSI